jgi:AcrR family transcriptional regulator
MENFFSLRAEKQAHIVNAALHVFSRNGYRKASIGDIAHEAGIAKGMVFYYFGSKKNLFMFLVELCGREIFEAIQEGFKPEVTEFFDRMKMMTDIKITALKKHPASNAFLSMVYMEDAPEVIDDIKEFIAKGMEARNKFIITDADVSRFKPDVDPKLLDKFLVWAAEGLATNLQKENNIEKVEMFVEELYACLDMMKRHFYEN